MTLKLHLEGATYREIGEVLSKIAGKTIGYSSVARWLKLNQDAIDTAKTATRRKIIDKWIVAELPEYLDLLKRITAEQTALYDELYEYNTGQIHGTINLKFDPTIAAMRAQVDAIIRLVALAQKFSTDGESGSPSPDRHPFNLDQFLKADSAAAPPAEVPSSPTAGNKGGKP